MQVTPILRSKEHFLKSYNIDAGTFENTELEWSKLSEIYNGYLKFQEELEPTAILIFNQLMKVKGVHSVRYRIKDAEHLIEKIIRKKIKDSNSNITLENYKTEIKDLIGLRALHLYKEDWEILHDFIKEKWNLHENPTANYRKGDSQEMIDIFRKKG